MQAFSAVRYNRPRVLSLRNIQRPSASVTRHGLRLVGAVAVLLALVAVRPAAAQEEVDQLKAPRVDESHVQRVHGLIESWIRAQAAPKDEQLAALPPINVTGVQGMRITLRWAGERTMGIGEVFDAGIAADGDGVVDLVQIAAVATDRALQEVKARVRNSAIEAQRVENEEGHARAVRDLPTQLYVDVQVALPSQPVHVPLNQGHAVGRLFASGYHGLVLRTAENPMAGIIWPASALASNVTPESQIVQLLAQASLAADDATRIGQPGGPSLARFEVIHVVRPRAIQPATTLIRGNLLFAVDDFDQPTLDALADRLANNLARRLGAHRGDGQFHEMTGTFLPTNGEYKPGLASIEEVALTAYVLARRTRMLAARNPGSPMHAIAEAGNRAANTQLEQALLAAPNARANRSPQALALALMHLIEAPHYADEKASRDKFAAYLLQLQDKAGAFRQTTAEDAPVLSATDQSLAFAALASLYRQTRDASHGRAAALAQNAAWRAAAQSRAHSAMPWLLIGERKLHGLEVPAVDGALSRAQRNDITRQMLALAMEHQITVLPGRDVAPDDVLGGFDFSEPVPGAIATPAPDWHTVEALAFFAQAIREPDLVDGPRHLDLAMRCIHAGRFTAQLMFDDPSCFYVRSMPDCIGAVRTALDDNRLQVAPTALALLAAIELEQTLAEQAAARE